MAARVPGPLLRAIAAAYAWLDEASVPAAVVGGIAASLLGRPRVTKDVDVMAFAPDSEWPGLLEAGRRHGIEPRTGDALAFAGISRVLLLKHAPSEVELDLSFASLPFEREVIERASEYTIRGITLRVASPEDIVVMKALALRPRDVADIEAIVELTPRLDLNRIRNLLRVFTEALETDDFAAEFERILDRARRVR
jgi:hypothetical protein